jgi:predicted Zn-dependent protease
LAQALRKLGKEATAEEEFAIVQKLKEQARDVSREELRDYLGASITDASAASTGNRPLRWLSPTQDAAANELNQKRRQQLEEQLAQAQYELGLLYFREQRMAETLDTLSDLFRRQPDYAEVRKAYATALFVSGKRSEAVPLLRQLLDASEDAEIRRMLGQAYFRSDDYADAVAVLENHSWHDVPTQYMLATALIRVGQDEAAQRAFSALLAEHPDSAELQTLLGQAAAQQRDYAAALEYYQKALALDPSVPEAHLGIGLVKMRNGELQDSEASLRAELHRYPGDLRAKYYLAYVLGLLQKHSEAELLLRAIIARQPDFPEAHATLGSELLAQNRPAEALEQLLMADKLTPLQPKLNYQLGLAYRKLGRKEEAEQAFTRSREFRRRSDNSQLSDPMADGHD